jgi:hypothetical protein
VVAPTPPLPTPTKAKRALVARWLSCPGGCRGLVCREAVGAFEPHQPATGLSGIAHVQTQDSRVQHLPPLCLAPIARPGMVGRGGRIAASPLLLHPDLTRRLVSRVSRLSSQRTPDGAIVTQSTRVESLCPRSEMSVSGAPFGADLASPQTSNCVCDVCEPMRRATRPRPLGCRVDCNDGANYWWVLQLPFVLFLGAQAMHLDGSSPSAPAAGTVQVLVGNPVDRQGESELSRPAANQSANTGLEAGIWQPRAGSRPLTA